MANFKQIIEESFSQYSGAVLQSRALVDVRDCIKPSARQIFYSMYTDKFTSDKPFKKTLKAIGSAVRFYIHGDASCEGIIMRAGQPFALRYPLIEVEGSYGNLMETGNWAAPRYTASRLSKVANVLFTDINKDTIDDWRDNYDDTEKYPAVLPSKGFYNLVNGTSGIAVGAAASIPQFNLHELNNALITLLMNPDATFDELYCAPDFATGGTLINEKAVKDSLRVGTGKACMLRATLEYDKKSNYFTVTEMPYSVYTNTVCKELEAIVNSEDNPGIDKINDLTGETPKIRIYLEKGADPDKIEKFLYKNTSLQSSYGINMTMLADGRYPKVFGWKEILQSHLAHEKLVYERGFKFDLKKIEHRLKIINGIIKAIAKIEEVIQIIKTSKSSAEASANLQTFLAIDDEQAKAILDIKLARLAKLEIEKYEQEKLDLESEHTRISAILEDEALFKAEMKKGFEEVARKYGDKRRTVVTNIEIPKAKEEKEIEEVVPEDVVVILTQSGDIKRIPLSSFRTQKRNGKGVKTEDDAILDSISTNTIDNLMLFTSKGRVFKLLVDNIPAGTNASRGVRVSSLVNTEPDEKIVAVTSLHRKTDAKYVLFFTKQGLIKKTSLEEYAKLKKSVGIVAINIKEGDALANVTFVNEEEVVVYTKEGVAIRFPTAEIAAIGRVAAGVKAIKLADGDEVVGGLPVHKSTDCVAIITENGYGKKVSLDEFPFQLRAGKGVTMYRPSPQTGKVVGAAMVDDNDSLLLVGKPNSICINVSDLPLLTRVSAGNGVIKGSMIKRVVKL